MSITKLLVANRGEIAIRIMRAAAELRISSVAVFPEDDAASLHGRKADETRLLPGGGAPAYLDVDAIVEAARVTGSDALHPGYGFLSENPALARACAEAGLTFVGPSADLLELFGDKTRAREAAAAAGVPILPGTQHATSLEEAHAFFAGLAGGGAMIIKARAGGGGRGVRVVHTADEIDDAYARASSEANAAFGDSDVYVEQFVPRARHIEVQIAGDGERVVDFGERDCSIQRRHQKVVEIAPAPGLPGPLRARIIEAATNLAADTSYSSLGTFEFLVDATALDEHSPFAFIEANARLQVEHTVTEEVAGVDLVQLQLRLAGGASLDELGYPVGAQPVIRGFAIQARVNMETMRADGTTVPSGGELAAFEPPSGPGIRVDTFGYAGYTTSPRYDSLLAKLIAHSPSADFEDALRRTYRALCEFRIEGVSTNIPLLQALLTHPDLAEAAIYTGYLDDHIAELAAGVERAPRLYFEPPVESALDPAHAGVTVDASNPLAVLALGRAARDQRLASGGARPSAADAPVAAAAPDGAVAVNSPVQGTVVSIEVAEGDAVREGQLLVVMEAMKMEHEVAAASSGFVRGILVSVGDTIWEGNPLVFVEEAAVDLVDEHEEEEVDLDHIRPDLAVVDERRATTLDGARDWAVERRRRTGQRTTRENVDQLFDDGSMVEYGQLVLAAQRQRRSLEELIEKTSADGMVTAVGTVNGELFDEPASRVAVIAYDYTVLAGTQGHRNHRKTDRMVKVAADGRMPLVLFAEGGGGRPGDTDEPRSGPGNVGTFNLFPRLSGLVPMVGITSGRCFAGNASLLACCDVIIATKGSNIGMGGPAMVEGGGLGVFTPEEIGPMQVQIPNGVVDIAVEDEPEAVQVAKQYLSYFQGNLVEWEVPDQRAMRRIIPENRLRVYDIREVISTLADVDSVLELRKDFGLAMVTAFIRVEGKPVGIVANNPTHIGGAIDSDAADKGARFLQICDAFDIPVLFLCDTPGIMVGPEVEKTALVRHANRMFLVGANLDVPFFTVILRKSYGLGGIAMGGGNFGTPMFTVAWPTGEFGGMGLEGSVKLGYRDDLAAIEDPEERLAKYEEMVAQAYERGKALNHASGFGVDDAIDPADTRRWLVSLLASIRPKAPRDGKKRAYIDAW